MCLTRSETPKTGFLVTRLNLFLFPCSSYNLEGHGLIKSDGGDGANGGSGGRIAIILKTEIYFFGTHQALGGSGRGYYLTAGGPGSTYIEDKRYVHVGNSILSPC